MTKAQGNALTERRERVAYAKKLGVEKPHTMKKDALEAAITEAEAKLAEQKAKIAADPSQDGEIHDCQHGRMQVLEVDTWVCPPECSEPQVEDTVADALNAREATREAWLLSAVELLIPLLEQAGATNLRNRKISISVGFPSKTIRKRIGECWADRASANGDVNHMFVSPMLDDGIQVLGVVSHELVHADDNGESHHSGHFRRVATALGLTGKMTSTVVGPDLEPVLKGILEELGPYPHVKLNLGNVKKQTTRMIKAHCVDFECPYLDDETGRGYTVRLTQKWIEVGLPSCPCGSEMVVAD